MRNLWNSMVELDQTRFDHDRCDVNLGCILKTTTMHVGNGWAPPLDIQTNKCKNYILSTWMMPLMWC